MFRWLRQLFARRPYRTAQPWEVPREIRTKLRCAGAGIAPETVKDAQGGKADGVPSRPALEGQPPGAR